MTPEFKHHTFPNGLQVVAEVNPAGYTAAMGFFVRTGARDEGPGERGLSHFLEHMVFKGTERRSAADVNRELDELGGQANAYTSEEQTVYYTTVLPKYQDRALDLLCDILRPALRDDDFQTERKVILEEIAKYDDQPPFGAFERVMETVFGDHPLGSRVLGTVESITQADSESMRAYFQRRYDPQNIILSLAGNIDFDGAIEQLDRLAGKWPTSDPDQRLEAPTLFSSDPIALQVPASNQTYTIRVGAAPSIASEDRFAMRILVSILGEEGGSRLFWDLIDTGRADVAATWTQEFNDAGLVFTYLSCAPEDTDANLRLIDQAINDFRADGPTDDEVQQAINRACAGLVLASERPSNRMFALGNTWQYRRTYETLDQHLAKYRSVNGDRIRSVLSQYSLEPLVEIRTLSSS